MKKYDCTETSANRAILASRLRRMLHIDRASDLLVAVAAVHPMRLGEKDGQREDSVGPSGCQFSLLTMIAACSEAVARAIKTVIVATMMRIPASLVPPGGNMESEG